MDCHGRALHRLLAALPIVAPPKKNENLLLNFACNIIIPTVVLMRFSADRWLGPLWGLVVALAFPLAYGVYDLIARRKTNFLSILGLLSVLASGSLGLLKVGGFWFAVKDAAIPTVFGIAVLVSLRSKTPIVREFILNEQVVDVDRVTAALDAKAAWPAFNALLRRASVWMALTFLGSAVMNFLLARAILRSPPGTAEFTAELGKMHWIAPLVIAVPMVAVMMAVFWRMMNGLAALTGLTEDELFRSEKKSA